MNPTDVCASELKELAQREFNQYATEYRFFKMLYEGNIVPQSEEDREAGGIRWQPR